MPALRRPPGVDALLVADLHGQAQAPVARSAEPSWEEALRRPLRQLRALWERHFRPPVVIAGDVFNRPDVPPWVINLFLEELPPSCGVPGQHDLPNHRLDLIRRSAFWTLVQADRLRYVEPGSPMHVGRLVLYGFPWGVPVVPRSGAQGSLAHHIAVVHATAWVPGSGYEGAPDEGRADRWAARLRGYDWGVFGDNHKPFTHGRVYNCGGLYRRNADERAHRPSVGVLLEDGRVVRVYLDCAADRYLDVLPVVTAAQTEGLDLTAFVAQVERLRARGVAVDFGEALRRHLNDNKVAGPVREMILEAHTHALAEVRR